MLCLLKYIRLLFSLMKFLCSKRNEISSKKKLFIFLLFINGCAWWIRKHFIFYISLTKQIFQQREYHLKTLCGRSTSQIINKTIKALFFLSLAVFISVFLHFECFHFLLHSCFCVFSAFVSYINKWVNAQQFSCLPFYERERDDEEEKKNEYS